MTQPTYEQLALLVVELRAEIIALRADNEALHGDNEALRVEVASLRRQVGRDSSNSSKPPQLRWASLCAAHADTSA